MGLLPAHELLLQILKKDSAQAFSEEISELVARVDFYQLNVLRADMLTKPMIFYGIVLRSWSHLPWLEFA
jgi:hypothetical protein